MNQRELEVLNIVCAAAEPLTSTDIADCKRELTQSTVNSVLRKLLAKGAVEVSGVTHSGKVLSRTYIPGAKAKELISQHYEEMFVRTKNILPAEEIEEIMVKVYGKTGN